MRSALRNIFLASAFVATAALATITAQAERLNVPFSFTVAGKTCPAGIYSVDHNASNGTVTLRNLNDWSRSFTWLAGAGDPTAQDTRVILRFDAMPDGYVLQSVQYRSAITARLDRKIRKHEYVPTRMVQGE